MRILVTGGTGFIGRHVAGCLERRGHEVTILCRRGPGAPTLGRRVRLLLGDVTDPASLHEAVAGQDAVVHAAGLVGARSVWRAHARVDVAGTRNVVRAAIAAGVPRLVHVSSLIVHATRAGAGAIRESGPLRRGRALRSPYARAKLLAEREVFEACRDGRIAAIVLRPGLVLGPGDRWTTPWMLRLLERSVVPVIGRGENRIPCVAVEELAQGIARAATDPALETCVLGLAARDPMTQRAVIECHARATGRALRTVRIPERSARVLAGWLDAATPPGKADRWPSWRLAVDIASADAVVDCARAAARLGWQGTASCEDAIRRAVAWERSAGGSRRTPSSVHPPGFTAREVEAVT